MKINFKTTGWSKMIAFLLCFVMLFQISSAFAIEEDVPTESVNAVVDTVTETEEEIQTEPDYLLKKSSVILSLQRMQSCSIKTRSGWILV